MSRALQDHTRNPLQTTQGRGRAALHAMHAGRRLLLTPRGVGGAPAVPSAPRFPPVLGVIHSVTRPGEQGMHSSVGDIEYCWKSATAASNKVIWWLSTLVPLRVIWPVGSISRSFSPARYQSSVISLTFGERCSVLRLEGAFWKLLGNFCLTYGKAPGHCRAFLGSSAPQKGSWPLWKFWERCSVSKLEGLLLIPNAFWETCPLPGCVHGQSSANIYKKKHATALPQATARMSEGRRILQSHRATCPRALLVLSNTPAMHSLHPSLVLELIFYSTFLFPQPSQSPDPSCAPQHHRATSPPCSTA